MAGLVGVGLAVLAAVPRRLVAVGQFIDVLVAFPTILTAMSCRVYGGSVWTAVVASASAPASMWPGWRARDVLVLGTDYVLAATGVRGGHGQDRAPPRAAERRPVLFVQLSLCWHSPCWPRRRCPTSATAPRHPPRPGADAAGAATVRHGAPARGDLPGLAITATVLGFSLLGDALREATDHGCGSRGPRTARSGAARPEVLP